MPLGAPLSRRTFALGGVAALAFTLAFPAVASAATITTPGPLTEVIISDDLNCDVRYLGDAAPEFFQSTACATLVAADGTLYGPDRIPAGASAGPRTSWTPVSQQSSGSGTSTDPFVIETVVTGGDLTVTQLDSYVTGANSYRTTTTVTNNGSNSVDSIVYHGGDCYLQENDYGYGVADTAIGAVSCVAELTPGSRIEQFIPLTAGSTFTYDVFYRVWGAIGTQQLLDNALNSANLLRDNGMALAWATTLAPGASESFSMLTNFSPIGTLPVTSEITTEPTVASGTEATVNVGLDNPNVVAIDVDDVAITLPAGFSYVAGSTTGSGEPTQDGNVLHFPGPFSLAADGGTAGFSFRVTASGDGMVTLHLAGTSSSGAPVLESRTDVDVTAGAEPTATTSPTATTEPTTEPTTPATTEPTTAPSTTAPAPATSEATTVSSAPSTSATTSDEALATTGADRSMEVALIALAAVAGGAIVLGVRRGLSQR